MKRNSVPSRKSSKRPLAWRESDYAALRANGAHTYDDRVSDSIFDIEDERAAVDIIVHGMMHDAN